MSLAFSRAQPWPGLTARARGALARGALTMLVACALTMLVACAPAELALDALPSASQATVHVHLGWTRNRRLDLLIIPDDTVHPFEAGSPWATWLAALGKALEGLSTTSLHVAVLPTASRGACLSPGTGDFASRDRCGAEVSYAGDLGPTLGCLVEASASSSSPAPPLAALEAFASSPSARPLGFSRSSASFVVLVLAGHDARDENGNGDVLGGRRVREAVQRLVPNPVGLRIAVVGPADCSQGKPTSSAWGLVSLADAYLGLCQGVDESVDAVIRLLSPPVSDAGLFCLPSPVRDADPRAPGLQPVASLSDARYDEEDDGLVLQSVDPVPACNGTTKPCWEIGSWQCPGDQLAVTPDPDACSSEDLFTLDYETCVRPGDPACSRASIAP